MKLYKYLISGGLALTLSLSSCCLLYTSDAADE